MQQVDFVGDFWIMNSTGHHTIHHTDFNYNYGQYFSIWDRLGGLPLHDSFPLNVLQELTNKDTKQTNSSRATVLSHSPIPQDAQGKVCKNEISVPTLSGSISLVVPVSSSGTLTTRLSRHRIVDLVTHTAIADDRQHNEEDREEDYRHCICWLTVLRVKVKMSDVRFQLQMKLLVLQSPSVGNTSPHSRRRGKDSLCMLAQYDCLEEHEEQSG